MKAKFLKEVKVKDLLANVEANLDLYRNGNFDFLNDDPSYYFETSLVINSGKMAAISADSADLREVKNCILLYEGIENISPYLARDERLWVFLTHTLLMKYTRTRWPIPQDNQHAIKHIKTHFFCIGARGIERDNSASRLWWLAALCNRVGGIHLEDALTSFLYQSDVRANMVERPTTSQNVNVFSAILKKLHESYLNNKELFERTTFRAIMKELNLIGGVRLLNALPEKAITLILEECIANLGKSRNSKSVNY